MKKFKNRKMKNGLNSSLSEVKRIKKGF